MNRAIRCAAVLAAVAAAKPALGVGYTWSGEAGGVWSDRANWGGSLPVSHRDTTLTLAGSGAGFTSTNDFPGAFQLNSLTVSNRTLAGGALEFITTSNAVPFTPKLTFSTLVSGTTRLRNDLVLTDDLYVTANSGDHRIEGTVSGPGALVLARSTGSLQVLGENTHTGGTWIQSGAFRVTGARAMGSGPVLVGRAPLYALPRTSSPLAPAVLEIRDVVPEVAPGTITVERGNGLVMWAFGSDRFALLNAASDGSLLLEGGEAPSAERVYGDAIDLSGLPGLWIGARDASAVRLMGALTPGGSAYQFGGVNASVALVPFTGTAAANLTVDSVLNDGVSARSVRIGAGGFGRTGVVRLRNGANSYSRGTVIESAGTGVSALLVDSAYAPGQTPLGTGVVTVAGQLFVEGPAGSLRNLPNAYAFVPGSEVRFNNSGGVNADRWDDGTALPLNGTRVWINDGDGSVDVVEGVGAVTYDGMSRMGISQRTGTARRLGFHAASVRRVGRGMLALAGTGPVTEFGGTTVFSVGDASGLVDAAGMVHPSVVGEVKGASGAGVAPHYLSVGADGQLRQYANYGSSVQFATPSSVVNRTASEDVTTNMTVHALRLETEQGIWLAPGKTLTIGSGGLSLQGPISGGSAVRFGGPEGTQDGIVWVPAGRDVSIWTTVDAPGGLTFGGGGALSIWAAVGKPLIVNEGTLTVRGGDTAGVVVNGGKLDVNFNATISGPIVVNGGTATIAGNSLTGSAEVNGGTLTLPTLTMPFSLRVGNDGVASAAGTLSELVLERGGRFFFANGLVIQSLAGEGTIIGPSSGILPTVTIAAAEDRTFGGEIRQDGTVNFNVNKTGPGKLTLAGRWTFASGTIAVKEGELQLDATNESSAAAPTFTLSAGTKLVFNADQRLFRVAGSGDVEVGSGDVWYGNLGANRVTVRSGGKLSRMYLSTLPNSIDVVGTLAVEDGARYELGRGKLAIKEGELARVRELIASGRNGGTWDGDGLTSYDARMNPLYGLAAIRNSDDGVNTLFETYGTAVGVDSVLVAYTLNGDGDLDGAITADDYARIDKGFLRQTSDPETYRTYRWGDFNYDDVVDLDDYALIDAAYLSQTTAATASSNATTAGTVPVPEAGIMGGLLVLAPWALRRRRRERSKASH